MELAAGKSGYGLLQTEVPSTTPYVTPDLTKHLYTRKRTLSDEVSTIETEVRVRLERAPSAFDGVPPCWPRMARTAFWAVPTLYVKGAEDTYVKLVFVCGGQVGAVLMDTEQQPSRAERIPVAGERTVASYRAGRLGIVKYGAVSALKLVTVCATIRLSSIMTPKRTQPAPSHS